MAITNESQLIDIYAIDDGCNIIEGAAEDYKKCKLHVDEAAATCTAEALSVEKKTMQGSIEEISVAIATVYNNIYSVTAQIRSAAMKIRTQQETELAQYRAEQARKQAEQQAAQAQQQAAQTQQTANYN